MQDEDEDEDGRASPPPSFQVLEILKLLNDVTQIGPNSLPCKNDPLPITFCHESGYPLLRDVINASPVIPVFDQE